jgi:hypothetical protein
MSGSILELFGFDSQIKWPDWSRPKQRTGGHDLRRPQRVASTPPATALPKAISTELKPRAVRRIEVAGQTIDTGADDENDADKVEIELCRAAGYSLAIDATIRHGRQIERKRWAAIMKSDEASGRFSLAIELACAMDVSAKRAIDILRRSPRPSRLAERMEGVIPNLAGRPPRRTGEDAVAASWDRAMAEFMPPERS